MQAAPGTVWRVVGDPNHLPRWWPKVGRVESVTPERFTTVFMTAKGRPIRADYDVHERVEGSRFAWDQQLAGSPFERFLAAYRAEVDVAEAPGGASSVTLTVTQKLRGLSRFGGFLAKRGMRKQLDEALDGLEGVL